MGHPQLPRSVDRAQQKPVGDDFLRAHCSPFDRSVPRQGGRLVAVVVHRWLYAVA